LHEPGNPLLLANAWDAGTAALVQSAGARAIATTSAGLAWSHGHPDGNALPPRVLAAAVAEIARVLAVPLTVDVEGGYADDPRAVGEHVAAVVDAGAVGVNLEDGAESPDLLCAKIQAAKTAAATAGVDLFVNARTDVYLRGLVPADRAEAETIARAARYRAAGCDGIFVPYLAEPAAIGGVARVSAGSAIAHAALGTVRRLATRFLAEGRYDAMFVDGVGYGEMNALLASPRT
jgi:2-methylisocitrate lyase-like PEP mutase family enzyme